ncbi:hypothetical protein QNH26_09420 [Peribacillus frigoritolerans]|uniref:hypothetical protein n=1 Tax=Peribacillus frigoritolerans TaxID=450367 RepID=UPI0024C10A5B|nr:hypothetical protein [Peribacillus frigoritolerans]WHX68768.1 hypothetical protein QNH26_09420 [Peribacillus frigoritolerans]
MSSIILIETIPPASYDSFTKGEALIQLGHTPTTTAALYTNPEQEMAKKTAKLLGEKKNNYLEKD